MYPVHRLCALHEKFVDVAPVLKVAHVSKRPKIENWADLSKTVLRTIFDVIIVLSVEVMLFCQSAMWLIFGVGILGEDFSFMISTVKYKFGIATSAVRSGDHKEIRKRKIVAFVVCSLQMILIFAPQVLPLRQVMGDLAPMQSL